MRTTRSLTLQTLNRAVAALLLALATALIVVVLWGLQQLQSTYGHAQNYYRIRETLAGGWRSTIETYLHTGDGVALDAAIKQLLHVTQHDLPALSSTLRRQLQPQLQNLETLLGKDLRAAGKLAGEPQALLINAESELRGKLSTLAELASANTSQRQLAFDYLQRIAALHDALSQLAAARERYARHPDPQSRANVDHHIGQLAELQSAFKALPPLGVYRAAAADDFEAMLGGAAAAPVEASVELRREIESLVNRYPAEIERTDRQLLDVGRAHARVRTDIAALLQTLSAYETQIAAEQAAIGARVRGLFLGILVLVLSLSGAMFFLQYRLGAIARKAGAFLQQLAAGDLRGELQLRSHIKEMQLLENAIATLQATLVETSTTLSQRSRQVSAASQSVLASTQQLQHSLAGQLAQSTQALATVIDLSASSQTVAHEVTAVVDATVEADRTITSGASTIGSAVTGMDGLAGEIAAAGSALTQLQADVVSIRAFVGHVQSIADQTNLLALNAAIEAARAGQQGRGFAVVADEVRTLARRCGDATVEIERLIDKVHASSANLAAAMQRQTAGTQRSAGEIRAAGAAYEELVADISRIRRAVVDIADLADRQHTAAGQVRSFIDDVVVAAQDSTERSRHSVSVGTELAEISGHIDALSQRFRH